MEASLTKFYLDLYVSVFPMLAYVGGLSAFIILYFSIKPDSRLLSTFILLGSISFLAPFSFLAMRWIEKDLPQKTNEIIAPLLVNWFAWWLFGIGIAIFFLRYIHPIFNFALTKMSRVTALERNHKTDVREISKYMPTSAMSFDPLKYFKFQKGLFTGLDEHRKPIYIQLAKIGRAHV